MMIVSIKAFNDQSDLLKLLKWGTLRSHLKLAGGASLVKTCRSHRLVSDTSILETQLSNYSPLMLDNKDTLT